MEFDFFGGCGLDLFGSGLRRVVDLDHLWDRQVVGETSEICEVSTLVNDVEELGVAEAIGGGREVDHRAEALAERLLLVFVVRREFSLEEGLGELLLDLEGKFLGRLGGDKCGELVVQWG